MHCQQECGYYESHLPRICFHALMPKKTAAMEKTIVIPIVMPDLSTVNNQIDPARHIRHATNEISMKIFVNFSILFVEFPRETVFGVFNFKAEGGKIVTNEITCRPILVCLCFHTLLKQHINNLSECFLTCIVSSF